MRLPRVLRLFVLLSILAALPIVAAPAAAASKPPKGDNSTAPVDIALNSQKTIKRIENATMEAPGIEDTSCDMDDLSDHSVWFRFSVPFSMLIDIDAAGSIIRSDAGVHGNVALSYYELDGGLIHRGCTTGVDARLEDLLLSEGDVYYVRVANIGQFEPTEPSRYRLSLRVRETLNIPKDQFVGTQPLGINWHVKHAGDPPKIERLCPNGCYVRFNGVAKGKIFQKVDVDPSVLRFKPGDVIYMTAYVFLTPPEGSDIKISLKINYSDGTPPTKVNATRHFVNTSTNLAQNIGAIVAETAGMVSRLTFTVSSPQTDDVFGLLSIEANAYPGSGPRGVLPLPLHP